MSTPVARPVTAARAPCRRRSSPRAARSQSSLAAALYVWTRDLHSYPNFDEGNYLGSLDALRHGQALGQDVFLDQPPGWYLLLVAVSYPFGNSLTGVRHRARGRHARRGGRRVRLRPDRRRPGRRVVAAAVMAVARPLPGFAATRRVGARVRRARGRRRRARRRRLSRPLPPVGRVGSGVVLAAATSVKLPGLTAALPIAALAVLCGTGPLARRLLWPPAGFAAVVALLVIAYRNALPQIWHGVFVTHARILGSNTATSNVHRAATFVDPRTPSGCLFIAGAIASIVLAVRGQRATAARGAVALGRQRVRLHPG